MFGEILKYIFQPGFNVLGGKKTCHAAVGTQTIYRPFTWKLL